MKKTPLHQKMKDVLWNRIRAINDDGLADNAPPNEAGKNNHFLEDFRTSLSQQCQREDAHEMKNPVALDSVCDILFDAIERLKSLENLNIENDIRRVEHFDCPF